uniref:Ig-like domain-containing protein n=1 Tax=Terrapene triunguis TaxID=2587831 RepID=A0A674J528_9SAUR
IMLWVPLLLLLGTWLSPGNTVKLSCTMSGGTSISGYGVSWYQQKPGNSPRYLLYYYSESSKGQGSGVPARFSGSKDTSSNAGYLTISGVLAEDGADYYCAAWSGSAPPHCDTDRWGSETKTASVFPPPACDLQGPAQAARFGPFLQNITQIRVLCVGITRHHPR